MKKTIFLLLTMVYAISAFSQKVEWILYDTFCGNDFKNGVTSFYEEGNYGLMNSYGEILIQPKFSNSFEFKEDVAIVTDPLTKLKGVINRDGEYVIKPDFEYIDEPECGFLLIKDKKENTGVYTLKGKEILALMPLKYLRVNKDSTITVDANENRSGLIDRFGNMVFESKYNMTGCYFGKIAYAEDRTEGVTYLKHLFRDSIIVCKSSYISADNIICVRDKNDKDLFYDSNLNLLSEEVIKKSKNGLYAYFDKEKKKYGFKNSKGIVVTPPTYNGVNEVYDPKNNLFHVYRNGKYGCVNGTTGKEIIPTIYSSRLLFDKNRFATIKNNIEDKTEGLISSDGIIIIETGKYDAISEVRNGLYRIDMKLENGKSKRGVFIPSKDCSDPILYDKCWFHMQSEGMIQVGVEENGKTNWGFVNEKGNLQIPCKYDRTNKFSEGLAVVELDGNKIVIDKSDRVILETTNELRFEGDYFSEGVLAAYDKKNFKYGYIMNPLFDTKDIKEIYHQTMTAGEYKSSTKQNQEINLANSKYENSNADELYNQAVGFFDAQDYESAVKLLAVATLKNEKNADYFNLLGDCFHNVGDYNNAIGYYDKALSIDPEHKTAKLNLKKAKRARKWEITQQVLLGISIGLNSMSNTMNSYMTMPGNTTNYNNSSTISGRICNYCNGTGECYLCNKAGQSKACVSNMFGASCKEPYCINKNHRCSSCGGTHVCQHCRGTGKR